MVEAFSRYKGGDRDEGESGLTIKNNEIIRFLLFFFPISFGLDECIFPFPVFVFYSSFSLSLACLKHELFIEGEGCVGVRGVTFQQQM